MNCWFKFIKGIPNSIKVMLIGQADEDAIERAQHEANLHYCLHKPWSERELIEILESSLNNM